MSTDLEPTRPGPAPGPPPGPIDVLIYVQHLLGIGHLRRAAVIARALDAAGLRVALVSGGLPVPDLGLGGARLVQLPPLRTRDESFSALVDAEGRPVDEAMKAERRERLLALYRDLRPGLLIFELFPFGRRQLRFELEPLIAAARAERPRPWLLCSLRDILNTPWKPEKAAWIVETVQRDFDRVLVHGDPALARLEESFPRAAGFADKLRYTGYMAGRPPAATSSDGDGAGEVLVSTGGGAVGEPLIRAALAARPLSALATAPWRILVGHSLGEAAFEALRAEAPPGVVIERARPDFTALLARCRLSISQAGYNTAIELVQAGVPAVVVPFAGGGETEQSLRARRFEARDLVTVVAAEALSGPALAAGIERCLARAAENGAGAGPAIAMDGAARTAEIVSRLVARRPGDE